MQSTWFRWGTVILVILLAIGVAASSAHALSVSSVEGNWSNVVGGSNITYEHDAFTSYGNQQADQVRWGSGTSGQSGLGFTGAASGRAFGFGELFEIGQLHHFNNPIAYAASSVNFTLNMMFDEPAGLGAVFDFTFAIDETPNATGNPVLDADYIDFPDAFPPQTFDIAGVEYTLELVGFGDDSTHLLNQFISPERQVNVTKLWSKITEVSSTVPEPGTLFLLGLGMFALAGLTRHSRR